MKPYNVRHIKQSYQVVYNSFMFRWVWSAQTLQCREGAWSQDPFLFAGTLGSNLDPTRCHTREAPCFFEGSRGIFQWCPCLRLAAS